MKPLTHLGSILLGLVLLTAGRVDAADAKTYQVTGPVLEVTPTAITVQKGEEKWQIARDKGTKLASDIKVGSKVTIYYRMVATEVEIKEPKDAKETKAKDVKESKEAKPKK